MSAYALLKRTGFNSDGGCAYLTFLLDDGREESLCLLYDLYGALVKGRREFGEQEYRKINREAEFSSAVLSGFRSLSCATSSESGMCRKLCKKGFSRDVSARAARYFAEHGYINEKDQIVSEVKYCVSRAYGPNKIRSSLISKGYKSKLISAVMKKLEGYSFEKCCRKVAEARGISDPSDIKEIDSLQKYLLRCGYDYDCVRKVVSDICEENVTF